MDERERRGIVLQWRKLWRGLEQIYPLASDQAVIRDIIIEALPNDDSIPAGYITGRLYTGILKAEKQRVPLLRKSGPDSFCWLSAYGSFREEGVYDVRRAVLITPPDGLKDDVGWWVMISQLLEDNGHRNAAQQIMEQTGQARRGLQIGWHETKHGSEQLTGKVLWWDGDRFRVRKSSKPMSELASSGYTSVAYLGEGRKDDE